MQQRNRKAYTKTAIRIAPHLHQQLKSAAAERGTTMQDLTENALIKHYKFSDGESAGAAVAKR